MEFSDSFNRAVASIFIDEGLHSNDPADPGGDTWYGISRVNHPNEKPWPPSKERAKEIYWLEYWLPYKLDILPPEIAAKVENILVNVGPYAAIKCLEQAIGSLGHLVAVDGIIGSDVAQACRVLAPNAVLHEYREQLALYYKAIVLRHPEKKKFLNGWLNRAYA